MPTGASHPSRGRGLKLATAGAMAYGAKMSHPSRVRGLKLDRLKALLLGPGRRTLHGCVDFYLNKLIKNTSI